MPERERAGDGVSRRGFIRVALTSGFAGLVGVAGYGSLRSLIAEIECLGEPSLAFSYINPAGAELPVWYDDMIGEDALLSHFTEPGMGAHVMWMTIREGSQIHCGIPALLIRQGEEELRFPETFPRERFVIDGLYAVFNVCTHAGCRPTWQLLPQGRYAEFDPDRQLYADEGGRELVYCVCHNSVYDPAAIEVYQHPPPPDASGALYLGIARLEGSPASRGMPLIPLELEGERLIGRLEDPAWYMYLDYKDGVKPKA